jgi:hypothetical protein
LRRGIATEPGRRRRRRKKRRRNKEAGHKCELRPALASPLSAVKGVS